MLEPSRNRANGCWKRKTGLEKKLIICIAVLAVITVILAALYIFRKTNTQDECTSKYCVQAAAEILEFVDFSKDPCDHFYHFACGSYYKHAVQINSPSPFVTINNEFKNEMKSLIVDPIKKKDTNANILVKQFYQACMNDTDIEKNQNRAFMTALDQMGGWPLLNGSNWNESNFDWVDWYAKAKSIGLPVLGFFTLKRVESTANDTVLEVSGLPAAVDAGNNSNVYNKAMREVIQVLGGKDFHESENQEVFDFIQQLKKYQKKLAARRNLKGILKTLLAFGGKSDLEAVGAVSDLTEACPTVPWLKLLNSLSNNFVTFSNSSEVAFEDISKYCQSIDQLIKSSKPRTIANYLVWTIVHQTHMILTKDVRNAYKNMKDKEQTRFDICYAEADRRFLYVKETIYVRRRTPKIVRDNLAEMIRNIKEVFIEHLKQCDWMDAITRQAAIEKTVLIESVIGGEDELYDAEKFDKVLGLDGFKFNSSSIFEMNQEKCRRENENFFKTLYGPKGENWPSYFKNVMTLNAVFVQPLNIMILPAPILSSLFYNYKMPAFMNYGSIGRIIGHEIMHGFEKSARKVLLANDEYLDWWTNQTADAYDKKVQCIIDEYEKIPFKYRLNGTLTMDENISDFVGSDVAYEAYMRYMKKHGKEKKLPGVPLTPEQIYWVQTGTFLCFRKLDDDSTDFEEEDVHAIPEFRVEGGAKHSSYFAKDFNCPEGSRMNPIPKCQIL